VVEAKALEGLKLWLRFSDGTEGVVDLSREALPGLLGQLRDPGFFVQVRVDPELKAPVWPGGLDLDPWSSTRRWWAKRLWRKRRSSSQS
jgi:hypothetical protein